MTRDKRQQERRRAVRRAKRNRDQARAKLLSQHRRLAARRKKNRQRTAENGDDGDGPHSTVPPMDTEDESAAGTKHSTVPRRPQGSDEDPPRRLYGLRLRRAARDADDEETSR